MKKIVFIILAFILVNNYAQSQGCVAIRSTGGFCTGDQAVNNNPEKWSLTVSNRYFKSFRHFVGTAEQKERGEKHTEVINHSYTLDLALARNLGKGWSILLDVPIISNVRSSLYEHGGNSGGENARRNTSSFGLGDVRIVAYKWLFDQTKSLKGNVQVGLGIKLPTGDYRYQDYFYKNDTTKVLGPVDQSIQLGDGGTGFSTEINAFYNFSRTIGVYGNIYYLFNPREQNGVSTARGGTPSSTAIRYGTDVMSVPDQYMLRGGVSINVDKLSFLAGIRDECQPAKDLLGKSGGFRRPGYIISAEPGVTYQFKKATAYAFVPFALQRNRTQSNGDKIRTQVTGVYAQGDAAFADYLVNVGMTFRF